NPVLIDRAPKPVLLAGDLHLNFVQVPLVTRLGQAAANLIGKGLAKLQAPLPHSFMADDDATFGEDLVDVTQAEGKAEIEPDSVGDYFRREAVTSVARWIRCCHQRPGYSS